MDCTHWQIGKVSAGYQLPCHIERIG